MSHTSTKQFFIAKIFACTFFLIGGHLFASDWFALTGTNLSDHWVTEGAWILEDDGVIHLPKREYTHWKNYENYLVLKDILVTIFNGMSIKIAVSIFISQTSLTFPIDIIKKYSFMKTVFGKNQS